MSARYYFDCVLVRGLVSESQIRPCPSYENTEYATCILLCENTTADNMKGPKKGENNSEKRVFGKKKHVCRTRLLERGGVGGLDDLKSHSNSYIYDMSVFIVK